MSEKIIKIDDRLVTRDSLGMAAPFVPKVFRTEVTLMDDFGKVLFSKRQNETVIGGAVTVLEKITGLQAAHKTTSINTLLGINDIVDIADSSAGPDDIICLWGAGIGGSGDAMGSRLKVNFYEREIGQNGKTFQHIPLRVVTTPFSAGDDDYSKYYMRGKRSDGMYEYYCKAFETTPVIKTLWKDGEQGEDGTEIEDDIWNTTREDQIEVFLEMKLRITQRDFREYFENIGQLEQARINTLGIFTGRRTEVEAGRFDYTNVKLFSKITMDNESLQNNKALSCVWKLFVH